MSVKGICSFSVEILRSVGIVLVSSLALELLFALILKWSGLSSSVVMPVNQVLKVVAIFLGTFFGIRGELGMVKGLVVGIVSIVLCKFVFSFLAGNLSFDLYFLLEVLFGGLIGAICGILAVNLRKS